MIRNKLFFMAILLAAVAAVAGMPELTLNPEGVFSKDESRVYGLYSNESGERVGESRISCRIEDSTLRIVDSISRSEVEITYPGLTPIYGFKIIEYGGTYEIESRFTEDSIVINAQTPQGEQNHTQEIPDGVLLHNDQLLVTLRAMDFSERKQRFKLFNPANASVIEGAAVVRGIEEIEVPAGEFEAYRVALDFGTEVQEVYYEKDFPHRMLLYNNGTIQYRLE